MRLSDIANADLPPGTKGLPLDGSIVRVADLAGRGLNLLRGDLPMPVAVLKHSALDNNLRAMQAYIERVGRQARAARQDHDVPAVVRAPTRARRVGPVGRNDDAVQAVSRLADDIGVTRLILANQLVGKAEITGLARLWAQTPHRAYYVLVDCSRRREGDLRGFGSCPGAPPARLLIEMGMPHARCGVRTLEEGQALARAIQSLPHVELHGVEGYEGLIVSDQADRDATAVFELSADDRAQLCESLTAERLFAAPDQIIVSAGGSAYYDLVAHVLSGKSHRASCRSCAVAAM